MSQQPERPRRRRPRWEPVDPRQAEQRELQARLDRITRTIATDTIPVDELCAPPSPKPIYDKGGKRINTRHDRALDKLEMERHRLCTRLRELDPAFRPPHGMRAPKFVDRLYIPKEKEGTLNFIGLILGPRGNTQKRLEKDYACKVAIRGKGSVKDGRARGPSQVEDDEPLHVVITAEGVDGEDRINKCKKKIMDIITPRQDDDNDHKQAQLRELAQLNGTLRDQDRDFRPATRGPFGAQGGGRILCSKCGAGSHPTADCPRKGDAGKQADGAGLDADYDSFMATLNGVKPSEAAPANGNAALSSQHNESGAPGLRENSQGRPTPPWLLPGAYATAPAPPPPPDDMHAGGGAMGRGAMPPDGYAAPYAQRPGPALSGYAHAAPPHHAQPYGVSQFNGGNAAHTYGQPYREMPGPGRQYPVGMYGGEGSGGLPGQGYPYDKFAPHAPPAAGFRNGLPPPPPPPPGDHGIALPPPPPPPPLAMDPPPPPPPP